MAGASDNRVFSRRSAPPVLILASGERIRHMTIRPWMTAAAVCFVGLFTIGYLAATTYLVLRDDLIGAAMARQARIQHDYEDRISALRAQLDRITSRQLLDQQVVEEKVEKLLEQQDALFSRHGRLGSLVERAEESGLTTAPAPKANAFQPVVKDNQANASSGLKAIDRLLALDPSLPAGRSAASAFAPTHESVADRADRVFSRVTRSLRTVEQEQFARIRGLTDDADKTVSAMTRIMRRTGIDLATADLAAPAPNGIGGPFVEPAAVNAFDTSLDRLDAALNRLETVRDTARKLPFGNPAPGRDITSPFGNRVDPFIGRLALHAGVDFQAESGNGIRATGNGRVAAAGYMNGYGNMVEIDHGQGVSTRYGHMSSILVSVGDTIAAGEVIGKAGSTGRSTGPHIHYEVRRNGEATDPMHFLNAGMKLTSYLK
ncbi:M23 family metallopeptidase [Rhizobium sp. SAFR-030]|uniref:M23 family metallopeptidase n=1 Tax=Rhizobium sp. SAFR-030 TaxID=3387277 RepID=UPI003F7E59F9